ncbi:MAG: IS91 family transposase [Bacteroidota bacterium]
MRPKYEVADIIRQFLPQMNQQKLTSHHRRTLGAIQKCRTAELGGHIDVCDTCGHLRISYNSCRNRNCPKCQGLNKEMWVIQQEDMLLPVAYFHVVFTLPHKLNELCLHQPKFMYDLLMKAAWHTIKTLAKDPKWLGAKTAATMVLHTWSQTLILHPHVHVIVPNGGLDKDGNWCFLKRGTGNFLFPQKAMQKVFQGYFMAQLKATIESGLLTLPPNFPFGYAYKKWKDGLYSKDWVVYTKKPFSGVKKVVGYLARYSHRVAITNHRIKKIDEQTVTFEYKDYKDNAKKKLMTLKGTDFLQHFCLHILPQGFRKVRQYGFLANAAKAKSLALARKSLKAKVAVLLTRKERKALAKKRLFGEQADQCPCCNAGKMQIWLVWQPNKAPPFLQELAHLLG